MGLKEAINDLKQYKKKTKRHKFVMPSEEQLENAVRDLRKHKMKMGL